MNTRGGAEVYSHPFYDYCLPSVEFDCGWYKWFADYTTVELYSKHISKIKLPIEFGLVSV